MKAALLLILWLCALLFVATAASQSIVETLPGFSGPLPFKLETGYVTVGDLDEVELFYYFVESERNPESDPIVVFIPGGPGCSGFSVLVFEIGPLNFDVPAFNGSLPPLIFNPFSLTKVANVIFLDAPAGTGFSYATNSEAYHSSDTKFVEHAYQFIRRWFVGHSKFKENPLYIAGGSYTGFTVPVVALKISDGNIEEDIRQLPLRGFILYNLLTHIPTLSRSRILLAHRMGFISDDQFEAMEKSCNKDYFNVDPDNVQCTEHLNRLESIFSKINLYHTLEPVCSHDDPKPDKLECGDISTVSFPMDIALPSQQPETSWCRFHDYVLSYIWANNPRVQEALHVRRGTVREWKRCNRTLSFSRTMGSSVDHHRLLSNKGYRGLIYSGDHDLGVSYIDTLGWIKDLNLTIADQWRPWLVDDQIAGFTEKYKKNGYSLTFVTVKGAGHTPSEYRPKECLAMMDRWFSNIDL